MCDYDQCTTDASCPGTGTQVCSCQGQTAPSQLGYGSNCIQANCHTDADCGPGGYCSPTYGLGCGPFFGTEGWYCHTCADTCVNDSDCPTNAWCEYDPVVGHWSCNTGVCAG